MLNGVLVARLGLPSLAVTLGTMGAYRGLAFIIGSETGYTVFDGAYTFIGSKKLCGALPVSFLVFLLVAVGDRLPDAPHGVRPALLCGRQQQGRRLDRRHRRGAAEDRRPTRSPAALAGVAALVWIGQYGSARGDNADGSILFVVTAVVLGGIDINGGRGSILGVVLALFLLGTLRNGMGLANVAGPTQTVVLRRAAHRRRAAPADRAAHRPRRAASRRSGPPRRELGRRPAVSTDHRESVHQELSHDSQRRRP